MQSECNSCGDPGQQYSTAALGQGTCSRAATERDGHKKPQKTPRGQYSAASQRQTWNSIGARGRAAGLEDKVADLRMAVPRPPTATMLPAGTCCNLSKPLPIIRYSPSICNTSSESVSSTIHPVHKRRTTREQGSVLHSNCYFLLSNCVDRSKQILGGYNAFKSVKPQWGNCIYTVCIVQAFANAGSTLRVCLCRWGWRGL